MVFRTFRNGLGRQSTTNATWRSPNWASSTPDWAKPRPTQARCRDALVFPKQAWNQQPPPYFPSRFPFSGKKPKLPFAEATWKSSDRFPVKPTRENKRIIRIFLSKLEGPKNGPKLPHAPPPNRSRVPCLSLRSRELGRGLLGGLRGSRRNEPSAGAARVFFLREPRARNAESKSCCCFLLAACFLGGHIYIYIYIYTYVCIKSNYIRRYESECCDCLLLFFELS